MVGKVCVWKSGVIHISFSILHRYKLSFETINIKEACVMIFFFFLQNLLFSPSKPFSRGQNYILHDIDLMIDCFVSCFRIKPHNNEALKVCLNPNSSVLYHYVLISSLYRYEQFYHAHNACHLKFLM